MGHTPRASGALIAQTGYTIEPAIFDACWRGPLTALGMPECACAAPGDGDRAATLLSMIPSELVPKNCTLPAAPDRDKARDPVSSGRSRRPGAPPRLSKRLANTSCEPRWRPTRRRAEWGRGGRGAGVARASARPKAHGSLQADRKLRSGATLASRSTPAQDVMKRPDRGCAAWSAAIQRGRHRAGPAHRSTRGSR